MIKKNQNNKDSEMDRIQKKEGRLMMVAAGIFLTSLFVNVASPDASEEVKLEDTSVIKTQNILKP
jgi:hypothetical protein